MVFVVGQFNGVI